jgi:hypothetical protein
MTLKHVTRFRFSKTKMALPFQEGKIRPPMIPQEPTQKEPNQNI